MLEVLTIQVVCIVLYANLWFLIALKMRRNDLADIAWGVGFVLLCVTALFYVDYVSGRGILAFVLVAVWGLRLSLHIGLRNRGKAEDPRYQNWRKAWGRHATLRAYFQIFLLQGILSVIILVPATYTLAHPYSGSIWLAGAGIAVWLTGFVFEAVGDLQLARFKRNRSNSGRIITTGLWRYTRHPNYFGEVVLWWGLYLIACSIPGGWVTFWGPFAITILMLFVSGIPLIEKRYENNAEFKAYKQRTSAFFPLPPKPQGGT